MVYVVANDSRSHLLPTQRTQVAAKTNALVTRGLSKTLAKPVKFGIGLATTFLKYFR